MNTEMTLEMLQQKLENQTRLVHQLTQENEELYQQFNHLMIRNNKLLKRIDDQQQIIDDLHMRIEELQLISNNHLRINDRLRTAGGFDAVARASQKVSAGAAGVNLDALFERWKNFPGQMAHNGPNLRKQVLMLAMLYRNGALRATDLFQLTEVGGVTGARYVSVLKKFGLIRYTGARKKGFYEITPAGIRFIELGESSREGTGHVLLKDLPQNETAVSTVMDADDL